LRPWTRLAPTTRAIEAAAAARGKVAPARAPFRAWYRRVRAKLNGRARAVVCLQSVQEETLYERAFLRWRRHAAAVKFASANARSRFFARWTRAIDAADAAIDAAFNHRNVHICRLAWTYWLAMAGPALAALEARELERAKLRTLQLSRDALRAWRVAAKAQRETREKSNARDDLFVKVGAWLQEMRENKALTPSPGGSASPAGREARRAMFKKSPGSASPSPPLGGGAARVPESPSLSLVTPPRVAIGVPAPTLRVPDANAAKATTNDWLDRAGGGVSPPPAVKPANWLDLGDVTPPNIRDILGRPKLHPDDQPPPPAPPKVIGAAAAAKPPRSPLMQPLKAAAAAGRGTRKFARAPLGDVANRARARAEPAAVDESAMKGAPRASDSPVVRADATFSFREVGGVEKTPGPVVEDTPAAARGAGGLRGGSRARLERLAAKRRGATAASRIAGTAR
jgi:hypothetical protein